MELTAPIPSKNAAETKNAAQSSTPKAEAGAQSVAQPPQGGAPAGTQPPANASPPEADPRLKELEAQTKRFAIQQRKWAEERAAKDKEWAERQAQLKEYEEWKQYHADRLRNPAKYLEKDYGPEWYDRLTNVKLNGAPTGDLIASELDSRLGDFEKKLQAREAEINKRFEELQAKEAERATQEFHREVVADIRKNLAKYPNLETFADDNSVWQAVLGEIDGHFRKNSQAILAGEMEMLTADEAANIVEKRIEAYSRRFEEAKQKRQPAATQPPQDPKNPQLSAKPQLRTLSTDMTASSGTNWVPPKDDKERLQRAQAAAARVRNQQQ